MAKAITAERFHIRFPLEKVLEFLQGENVFSETEYNHYRLSCARMLVGELIRIARFDICSKSKKALYKQIQESNYYQTFLRQGKILQIVKKRNKIIFWLFKKKWYSLILFIVKAFDKIKKQ